MRAFPRCLLVPVMACLPALALAAGPGEGLNLGRDAGGWTAWHTQLAVLTAPTPGGVQPAWSLGAARVASDHYFDLDGLVPLGDGGGLRATGALLLGSRSLALGLAGSTAPWRSVGSPDSVGEFAATPYVGLGYSTWWHRGGLGLSADLGLMAQRPGQGLRALGGGSGLDNTVRALQLSPVFQLNLSYGF